MGQKYIRAVVIAAVGCLLFSACEKKPSEQAPGEKQVKTTAEYEAEAEKEIDRSNFAEQLEKIEKEMAAEAAAEQTE